MDTPRPTGDRVPLGDLTNTIHRGNHTRSGLVPLDGDHTEQKRQREREREGYATMSDEKRSERNKKPRQKYKMSNQENVDLQNNMATHSTDVDTNNETDENSDGLHRQSTYSSGLQQLSVIDSQEDISTIHDTGSGYAPSPINQAITCPKERRRLQARARRATVSPEQRALLNKRRRELYAAKNTQKEVYKDATNDSKGCDDTVPLSIGVPGDIDGTLAETDINTVYETDDTLRVAAEISWSHVGSEKW